MLQVLPVGGERTCNRGRNRWRSFFSGPPVVVDRQKTHSDGEDEKKIETTTETATPNAERTSGVDRPLVERKRTYTITAYCGCEKCCGKSDKITASGEVAVEGVTVATDTSIPFGTKIVIDGKTYTVQDRGGAIKGNRIDIYFDSHERALQYGRQTKEVTILKGE